MECTLIIQGKLSVYTLLSILKHKEKFNIVISTPKSSDEKLIRECINMCIENKNCSYVLYDENVNLPTFNNSQNRYFHFLSTLLGLELSKTEYSIKLRSDEFYSNLDPFLENIKKNPDKITTNDVFFRRFPFRKFHPSDHLVGGSTHLMKDVFTRAKDYSENPKTLSISPWFREESMISAENQLCYSIFDSKERKTTKKTDFELVKDNLSMVMSEDLGYFKVTWNGNNKEYFDSSYFNPDHDTKSIEDIEK
jgi:hypothetical protein